MKKITVTLVNSSLIEDSVVSFPAFLPHFHFLSLSGFLLFFRPHLCLISNHHRVYKVSCGRVCQLPAVFPLVWVWGFLGLSPPFQIYVLLKSPVNQWSSKMKQYNQQCRWMQWRKGVWCSNTSQTKTWHVCQGGGRTSNITLWGFWKDRWHTELRCARVTDESRCWRQSVISIFDVHQDKKYMRKSATFLYLQHTYRHKGKNLNQYSSSLCLNDLCGCLLCESQSVLTEMNGTADWGSIMRHLHSNPDHLHMIKMSLVTAHHAKWAFSVTSLHKRSNWGAIVCEIGDGVEQAERNKCTYISTERKKCVYVKHSLYI